MFEWDSNIYNVRKISITTVQLVFECESYPMGAGRTRSGCNRFCCDWRRVVHAECGSHPMSAGRTGWTCWEQLSDSSCWVRLALVECGSHWTLTGSWSSCTNVGVTVVECDPHWLSATRIQYRRNPIVHSGPYIYWVRPALVECDSHPKLTENSFLILYK